MDVAESDRAICTARRRGARALAGSALLWTILGTGAGGAQIFDLSRTQVWSQAEMTPPFATFESDDRFGAALAAGDFDCDGFFDLAIGAHREDLRVNPNDPTSPVLDRAGVVHLLFGTATGLHLAGARMLAERDLAGGLSEAGDEFGKVLTAGDFDGDGCDDLVIGSPEEDGGSLADSGVVFVTPGGPGGPETTLAQVWSQAGSAVLGAVEELDHFGSSLVVGDFNGDAYDDLAIGAFGEKLDDGQNEGAVWVLPGGPQGLKGRFEDPTGWVQLLTQDDARVRDTAEVGDRFGWALAACDLNGDGYDDLIVGVPGEDDFAAGAPRGTFPDTGAVHYLFGSPQGIDLSALTAQGLVFGSNGGDQLGFSLAAGALLEQGGHCSVVAGTPFVGVVPLGGSSFEPQAGLLWIQPEVERGQPVSSIPWTQEFLLDPVESDDLFGWTLLAADILGSGGDHELVVGVWAEDVDGAAGTDHGLLHLALGSTLGVQNLHGGDLGPSPGSPIAEAELGYALASGDFDGNGADDLAAGAPGTGPTGLDLAGSVQVLYSNGLLFADRFEEGSTVLWSATR